MEDDAHVANAQFHDIRTLVISEFIMGQPIPTELKLIDAVSFRGLLIVSSPLNTPVGKMLAIHVSER